MLGPQTSPCQTRFFRFFSVFSVFWLNTKGRYWKVFFAKNVRSNRKPKKPKKPMSQIECWVPRHLPVRLGFFGFFCFLVEYQGPVLESVFSKKCPKQPKKPKKTEKTEKTYVSDRMLGPQTSPCQTRFFGFFGFFGFWFCFFVVLSLFRFFCLVHFGGLIWCRVMEE